MRNKNMGIKMNKKGYGPNLTWTVLAIAAFITVVVLVSSMYSNFYISNGIQINSEYTNVYDNISSQASQLDTINGQFQASGWKLVTQSVQSIGATLNSFAIGFGAIQTLLVLPTIMQSIFNTIASVIGIPPALSWFITFTIIFYIGVKVIQALRGTINEV